LLTPSIFFSLLCAAKSNRLPRTSLAVCRLLLSLDPLRDPTGALLQLDRFCLACQTSAADAWLVQLVQANCPTSCARSGGDQPPGTDSDCSEDGTPTTTTTTTTTSLAVLKVPIRVWYRDEQDPRIVYSCTLVDMPNFLYSYALALFRLSLDQNHPEELKKLADAAMQKAVRHFPSVVMLLLDSSCVDTTGRSFRRDWMGVLDFCADYDRSVRYRWRTGSRDGGSDDTIVRAATEQAADHVAKIYARLNASFWSDEGALQFLYDNLKKVQETHHQQQDGMSSETWWPPAPNPALMRYSAFGEDEYDDRVQLLPPDAEVVDVGLLEEAMRIDPNRRRLIRRPNRRRGGDGGEDDERWFGEDNLGLRRRPPHWLGGPPTGVVDPDWPLLEVFWRSFLPWNHVEGVVPPPRQV
jgi:Transcriptional repressor TCF25